MPDAAPRPEAIALDVLDVPLQPGAPRGGGAVDMAGGVPPLRGRDVERDLLRTRISSARRTGRGSVVVLSGAAGSGKSRLLQEVRALAVDAGARLLRVAGDPDGSLLPHGAVLEAVQAGPDPLLERSLLARLPAGPEQGWWLQQELLARLQEVAMQQPVVICVDDLQWCGHGTLQLLRALPPQLRTDAVVWVVSVRNGPTDPAVAATVRALFGRGAERLDLRPLDEEAVAQLVGDILGAVPDDGVLTSAARAQGHPLLLVELLGGWKDEQLVQVDEGRARLSGQVLPARLRDAVDRRTERLSPVARELLQVGAVLGRRCSPDLLAAMLDRPVPAVLAPLQEVIAAGLLRDDGEQLGFDHDLVREAVTAGIPAGFARVLRRHAVDVMLDRGASTLQVATMLAESALPGDLAAVATLRQAAATLSETASPAAADLSLRALELVPEQSLLRLELAQETVVLLWRSGRADAARRLAATMASGTPGVDPAAEARVRLRLARSLVPYAAPEAVQQCEVALALPDLPDDLSATGAMLLALNHVVSGDTETAEAVLAPVRDSVVHLPGSRVVLARAASTVAFHRHEWDRALRLHADVEGEQEPWTALFWTSVGHPGRALALVDAGTAAARRDSRFDRVLTWSRVRSRVLHDAGRLDEALAEARGVLELEQTDLVGGPLDLVLLTSVVRAALHAGRPDVVRAHRARFEQATRAESLPARRNGLWLTAMIADAAGDPEAALVAAAEAVASLDRPGSSMSSVPDLADEIVLTRIALRAGDRAAAGRAVASAERKAAANPSYPMAAAAALQARGLLDDDEASLREAVRVMGGTERPVLLASVQEDLARRLASDRPREAVALLDQALGTYAATGAEHDAARARRRLRDLGVRRRRGPVSAGPQPGPAGLTPAERDVVRLVADGGTNRSVAAALFVSPHTVSTHLRSAFTKLGVRSRLELARLVAEQGAEPR